MKLDDKTAIITGASSGIGEAAARLFASEGAHVILGARRAVELDRVAKEIRDAGGVALSVAGDVRDEAYAKRLVEVACGEFGGLDVAFNNAGTLGAMGDLPGMKLEDWNTTIATNLTSAFLAAKYQLPAMIERGAGSVIFTSTFVGYTIGLPNMAAYAAGKAGLIGMTQCLAVEHGPAKVRINALLPGGTKTNMMGDFSTDPKAAEAVAALHALKRMAEPDEIAKAALFLASDDASFVTGSAMVVDGGNSICKG